MDSVSALFSQLWKQYVAVTPSAARIHHLLGQGEPLINDHIAIRTFDLEPVCLQQLAQHVIALGYHEGGDYQFAAKKLHAKHFEHPDPSHPKIFISELETRHFSPWLQHTVASLVAQLAPHLLTHADVLTSGRGWQLSFETYQALQKESEYAAWLAAWGFRANHFTVSVNHLSHYTTLDAVNHQLEHAGFTLNSAGGTIKGAPDTLLEQSSTMADHASVQFSDGSHCIPSCFYEFARRYPQPDGTLFSGFVPASADKIFESTHSTPNH